MERVQLIATIRVPEQQTSGLVDRLRKANRPGLKLELLGIKYRPAHQAISAANRELRQEIYRDADEEVKILNAQLPSDTQPWRVFAIKIEDARDESMRSGRYRVGSTPTKTWAAEGEEVPGVADVEAGMELRLTATVTLGRLSLPLKPYGKEISSEA